MSYPYLSVNPCCTDVVLNSPCGCTSTITNSGCGTNDPCSTYNIVSSNVIYDGNRLPCIIAEPCDTLNVILQKMDQVICTLLGQISTLNNQVTNINNQLIVVTNNINTIYNTLNYCCVTTTTTRRPCENFSLNNTGGTSVAVIITDCTTQVQSAIILPAGSTNICVVTNSPLTVPGTVIVTPNGPCSPTTTSTTSTSSTSSTTTTTTTAIPCECLTFYNRDSVSRTITYKNCSGATVAPQTITVDQTIQVCGSQGSSNSALVTISVGVNCVGGLCPTTTTTSTSSSTTTTTSTTCNSSSTHPYNYNAIFGTTINSNFTGSLFGACTSRNCLTASSCFQTSAYGAYFNNVNPQIGDKVYGTATGCVLSPANNGYYIIKVGTTYTVIQVASGIIIGFPACT